MRRAHFWPAGSGLPDFVLTPAEEERDCIGCGHRLEICDHRFHRVETFEGPVRLVCKLLRCPVPSCTTAGQTFSPRAEGAIAPPRWIVDWKVFAWIGHRRFARHWSVAQIRNELADAHSIRLSDDVLENYVERYERMVAARHQSPAHLREVYADVPDLVLSIDGLQPEKGHEVLYVVRELNAGRVWCGPALSSANAESRRPTAPDIVGRSASPFARGHDKQDASSWALQIVCGRAHRSARFTSCAHCPKTLADDGRPKVAMRRRCVDLRNRTWCVRPSLACACGRANDAADCTKTHRGSFPSARASWSRPAAAPTTHAAPIESGDAGGDHLRVSQVIISERPRRCPPRFGPCSRRTSNGRRRGRQPSSTAELDDAADMRGHIGGSFPSGAQARAPMPRPTTTRHRRPTRHRPGQEGTLAIPRPAGTGEASLRRRLR